MIQSWWTCKKQQLLSISLFCLLIPIATAIHANPVILVMGDSLSAEYGLPKGSGWVKLLEGQLQKQSSPWTVFNASISGETTSGGLNRLPALLESKKPGMVLLELGANDALRGLSIEQTQNNLRRMIVLSKKTGAKVLLLGMQIPPNYGQQYTKQFKELYSTLAVQEGVELLPFFLNGVAANKELFQADNIHPNVAAQAILFKNVWGAMAPYQKLLQPSQ
ncbi:arylesterase [Polynucleobacter sp. AP-Feld-500C-C5]|uniref:arylesterase n=1 Tax=Polynucleobacter sp. AP-Feld-500C-C5 TaxID=2576924 RepID=UPI001C0E6962|nr:arylesterase [Polynucleobacter sp. AP-Feld-500C-C5]MBU3632082.1 arylesterase [Polynucleobacter sp. AP-Feld-500C-C5]